MARGSMYSAYRAAGAGEGKYRRSLYKQQGLEAEKQASAMLSKQETESRQGASAALVEAIGLFKGHREEKVAEQEHKEMMWQMSDQQGPVSPMPTMMEEAAESWKPIGAFLGGAKEKAGDLLGGAKEKLGGLFRGKGQSSSTQPSSKADIWSAGGFSPLPRNNQSQSPTVTKATTPGSQLNNPLKGPLNPLGQGADTTFSRVNPSDITPKPVTEKDIEDIDI